MDTTEKAALLSSCGKGVGSTWTDTSPRSKRMALHVWDEKETNKETTHLRAGKIRGEEEYATESETDSHSS